MSSVLEQSREFLVQLPLASSWAPTQSERPALSQWSSPNSNLTQRRAGRLFSFRDWDATCPDGRDKIVLAVAVEPAGGYGIEGPAASGDLWRLLEQDLKDYLQDPTALIILLTERLDMNWLGDFKATIVGDVPTRANIKFASETIASQCAPNGNCLIWISCDGRRQRSSTGREISVFKPLDGWDHAVTGQDMKLWISKMNASCKLKMVLEICHIGNFFDLPYEFTATGELVASGCTATATSKGPHIVCMSACHLNEKAWVGVWAGKKCGAFTLMLKCIVYERLRLRESPIRLKDIERLVTPQLNRWGVQRPLVAMSHADQADQDAFLTLP